MLLGKRKALSAALGALMLAGLSPGVQAQAVQPASSTGSPSPRPSASSSNSPSVSASAAPTASSYSLLTLTTTSTSTVTLAPGTPLPSGAGPLRSDATNEYLTGLVRTLTLSVFMGNGSSSVAANATGTTSNAAAASTSNTAALGGQQQQQQQQPALPLDTRIDPAFGVLGVWLIASGAVMAFWGVKSRWTTVFISG